MGTIFALIHTPVGCGKLVHSVRAERRYLPTDIDITGSIIPGIRGSDIPLADLLRLVTSLVGEHAREPERIAPVPLHLGGDQLGVFRDVAGLAGHTARVVVQLGDSVRVGGMWQPGLVQVSCAATSLGRISRPRPRTRWLVNWWQAWQVRFAP